MAPKLTGKDVETAFVETAERQVNGDAFNWDGVAERIERRLDGPAVHRSIPERRALLSGERR